MMSHTGGTSHTYHRSSVVSPSPRVPGSLPGSRLGRGCLALPGPGRQTGTSQATMLSRKNILIKVSQEDEYTNECFYVFGHLKSFSIF